MNVYEIMHYILNISMQFYATLCHSMPFYAILDHPRQSWVAHRPCMLGWKALKKAKKPVPPKKINNQVLHYSKYGDYR